jgi:ketosteroid isomerase-like protein
MQTTTNTPTQTVQGVYDAFAAGDMDRIRGLFAPDIVWVERGSHPLAGEYVGAEAVLGFFGAIMQHTQGTFRADLQHLVGDRDVVYALHRSRGERDGRIYDIPDVLRCEVTDGQVTRVQLFCGDQPAEDALFA